MYSSFAQIDDHLVLLSGFEMTILGSVSTSHEFSLWNLDVFLAETTFRIDTLKIMRSAIIPVI